MLIKSIRVFLLPLAAAALVLPAAAGAAEAVPDFTVEPAAGSSLAPEGGYFRLSVRPGAAGRQSLLVRNTSSRPIRIRLAAVDAETAAYGGVSYGLGAETAKRVGKWVSLETETLSLAARASATVPFTVEVPAGAPSGEHLGGLAIWLPRAEETEKAERGAGQAGASVTIQTRRVIALVVRVPGPAQERLAVTGVEPAPRSDALYLTVKVANRGGLLTKATAVLSLPDTGFRKRFEVDSIVPGTSVAYPLKWTREPRDGEHRVRVELDYGSQTTVWEGTFRIGEAVTDELVDRGGAGTADPQQNEPTPPALFLVGGGAAAALLLAGLITLAIRAHRTRRRRKQRAPALQAATEHDPDLRRATATRATSDDATDRVEATRPRFPAAASLGVAASTAPPSTGPAPARSDAASPLARGAEFADDSWARAVGETSVRSPRRSFPVAEDGSSTPEPSTPDLPRPTPAPIASTPAVRTATLAGAAVAGAALMLILGRSRKDRRG